MQGTNQRPRLVKHGMQMSRLLQSALPPKLSCVDRLMMSVCKASGFRLFTHRFEAAPLSARLYGRLSVKIDLPSPATSLGKRLRPNVSRCY